MLKCSKEFNDDRNDDAFYRRLLVAFDAETEAADADGSAEHHIPHVQVPTGLRRVVLFERRHVFHRENCRLPTVQLSVSNDVPTERYSSERRRRRGRDPRRKSRPRKVFPRPKIPQTPPRCDNRNSFRKCPGAFMRGRVRDTSIVGPAGPPSGASLCDATTNNRGGSGRKRATGGETAPFASFSR